MPPFAVWSSANLRLSCTVSVYRDDSEYAVHIGADAYGLQSPMFTVDEVIQDMKRLKNSLVRRVLGHALYIFVHVGHGLWSGGPVHGRS